MLYNLLFRFAHDFIIFNLFKYQTFRTGAAILTSLMISFCIGPRVIRWLKSKQGEGQPIRDDGPETHFKKKGTPTMGGLMILISLSASTLLWADLGNGYVWVALLVTLGFGAVGFADDYVKLTRRNTKGVSSRKRVLAQTAIGICAGLAIMYLGARPMSTGLAIPFVKDFLIPLGYGFVLFAAFVIVGAGNAVNLTDGLDGLASVPIMIAALCFGIISYLVGNEIFANYLQINHVRGTGELAIFCGAIVGSSVGFLWYNAPPAQVFMGDTGSLALGGALGTVAVAVKHELVLVIIGGLFVVETLSVIIQVVSFKMTGRRVFKMAPIHHHFEKLGWSEPTVVIRFWIVAGMLGLLGLSTLKLR